MHGLMVELRFIELVTTFDGAILSNCQLLEQMQDVAN